jgi:CheY-like chemotaxis protein
MGATQGAIMRIFLITGASIGVVGTVVGFLLGTIICLNIESIRHFLSWLTNTELFSPELYFLSRLPADMNAGETMAVVVMALTHLVENLDRPGTDIRMTIGEAVAMVRNIEQEVRSLCYLLHPPLLDELGLASALRWYVEGFNKRCQIKVSLETPARLRRLPRDKEMALFRVVQESLTNILRHSGSLTARIEVREAPGQILLCVEDEGRGIDRATLAKIENGKETLGVGIPGTRERLLQFGGQLEIHSGPQGTRVVASIPVEQERGGERSEPSVVEHGSDKRAPRSDNRRTRKRILVVDDHEVIRQGIRALLAEQEDLEVCGEAQDGMEAVLKTRDLNPDLIIMDLTMPQVGGLSAAYRIRQMGSESKILVFTTREFEGLERMIEKSGCDGIVVKSNAGEDLLRAAREVLKGKRFFNGARTRGANGEGQTHSRGLPHEAA